jgi:hypothetical protein
MADVTLDHPYTTHDALNEHIYDVARKVDRLLNREPIENHAAVLGLIQVSSQRRMHEHESDKKKAQMDAQEKVSLANKFSLQ